MKSWHGIKHFDHDKAVLKTNLKLFHQTKGGSRRGNWGDHPPKDYESNFMHHDFVQLGKQHSRYNKDILPSIVLSQPCCEDYFMSFTVVNP